ncbi:MAG: endonuclease/exonuclease/phosphatase family protein [Lachnospiraceae bacterium]|nr:endonuclease/exonuclease/phosphatase family protein [Lachnospiraceae bacterium]
MESGKKKKHVLKWVIRILAGLLGLVILAAAGYAAYLLIAYHRIEDHRALDVKRGGTIIARVSAGDAYPYRIVSYNIGFGAYEADYGFFMDGGTESWAWSEERLDRNLKKISALLKEQAADFYILQEVDYDSTRTYHVDERAYMADTLSSYCYDEAQNFDSPFLFYPFHQPHGNARSCLMTFSAYHTESAERISLPVEDSLMKLLDLDRCYSISRIPVRNGGELVLYNFHLSAYTSDGTIATEQLKMLLRDMQAEYEKGNYCIAGGDFNKDLSSDAEKYFHTKAGDQSWAKPLPEDLFDGYDVSLVFPYDALKPVPSCRNADGPYNPDQFVLTVDGFMVTANVEVEKSMVIDTGFAYSDHNPVSMDFILKTE